MSDPYIISGSDTHLSNYSSGGSWKSGCVAEGVFIRMADGDEIPVEEIKVGDSLMGLDSGPCKVTSIIVFNGPLFNVKTQSGLSVRCSATHAFRLLNGIVQVSESLGETILSDYGWTKVLSVVPVGIGRTYNVITDGSRTFFADGIVGYGASAVEEVEYLAKAKSLAASAASNQAAQAGEI